ncbi:MAG TPA: aromatic compound degradation protein PaaI, partial [Dermatophilaceae bacterium]|nr:aromatic compound degradation protein PaaI [Dermatophilaceae bacterium]
MPPQVDWSDVDSINAVGMGALHNRMGIRLTEAGPDRVVGTMPVEGNTQPYGLLHGGASVVLAEG